MNGNNILLVWPKTDKGFYDFHPLMTVFGGEGQFVPLPLLTIAAALGNDWEYRLLDEEFEKLKCNHLLSADFVFISINILQQTSALRIISLCQKLNKPVIVGGPLVSSLPHLLPPNVTKVIGEIESPENISPTKCESIALSLSRDMKKGILKEEYRAARHPDIKCIQTPRYDITNLSRYFILSMQTSRGCHHSCSFCQIPCLYGRHQRKTPQQLENELTALLHFGKGDRTIFIIDDNFIGNINNTEVKRELIEVIETMYAWQVRHDFPYDFFVQCSLEIADHEEILEQMARCGINMMFIGVETLDKTTLEKVKKRQNLPSNILNGAKNEILSAQIEKVAKLRHYGMGVYAGLMMGFDEDNHDSISDLIEFMQQTSIPIAGMTVLQAPPGTPLYKQMEAEGRISSESDAITKPFRSNMILKMDPMIFYAEYQRCIETIYNPQEYFKRCIKWVSQWNDTYLISGRKGSLKANLRLGRLLRSIWKQGIVSFYRKEYWSYIWKVKNTFYNDFNRIGISLYLGYFFEMLADNLQATRKFVKKIPVSICIEWKNHFIKCPPTQPKV